MTNALGRTRWVRATLRNRCEAMLSMRARAGNVCHDQGTGPLVPILLHASCTRIRAPPGCHPLTSLVMGVCASVRRHTGLQRGVLAILLLKKKGMKCCQLLL